MNRLTVLSGLATLILCWIPGGLIHMATRQVNAQAEAPAAYWLQQARIRSAAMVQQ